jgi:hypothetical protein
MVVRSDFQPFQEREPFVLSQLPHLYFTGEQLAATVRDPDDGPTRAPRNLKAHQMMDDRMRIPENGLGWFRKI